MCKTPRFLHAIPLVLVVFMLSCTQTPRKSVDQETEYIRMLREEFFKTHPDGEYNEHIKKGEVVKGMDFLEVLASWGNPAKRKKLMEGIEQWIYLEVDEDSKDSVQYLFIFKKNVLSDWEFARHFAMGGNLNVFDSIKKEIVTKGEFLRPDSGTLPKKK